MSTQSPKQALQVQFALVARALGHADRLELLEHLAQGERSVEALAQRAGLAMANASHHLQQLRRAGLVSTRREGKFIFYSLTDDSVLDVLAALRRVAETGLAEVDRIIGDYFASRDSLEPVSRAELMKRMRAGAVTVLDTRPADEYAAGHLPGALNISPEALETRLAELDPGQEIVAYCRGPYCVLSFEVVAELRKRGFRVRRLEDGMPEWKAAGLPVEVEKQR
ncbi:MAG: metalloregulator ArsR/SmtB family transcription factor [Pararhodobacter sp.]|nr:metalloregulator ArsR/SmtB family transcription factor [Pararhodobacter sp.]